MRLSQLTSFPAICLPPSGSFCCWIADAPQRADPRTGTAFHTVLRGVLESKPGLLDRSTTNILGHVIPHRGSRPRHCGGCGCLPSLCPPDPRRTPQLMTTKKMPSAVTSRLPRVRSRELLPAGSRSFAGSQDQAGAYINESSPSPNL